VVVAVVATPPTGTVSVSHLGLSASCFERVESVTSDCICLNFDLDLDSDLISRVGLDFDFDLDLYLGLDLDFVAGVGGLPFHLGH
jgi:hypothetical protein